MKIEWVNQVFLLNFKNLNNIMYFVYTMIIPVRFFPYNVFNTGEFNISFKSWTLQGMSV